MIKYLKLLLWPFSLLYGSAMALRNYLFDTKVFPSHRFDLPVIAVGNLTVGGTGKTPHVEYLIRLLSRYKIGTLSRGYKRRSKGFILADERSTVEELGDEPYQYHLDFKDVKVAVSEKRVHGVERLLELQPSLDLIILDDAMQHRHITPSLSIMLSDYKRLFYNDYVMPAGMLREFKCGAARTDLVIISKCPKNLGDEEMGNITKVVKKHAGDDKPVFFTTVKYGKAVPLNHKTELSSKVILLTGIANPKPLKSYLNQSNMEVVQEYIYSDHHHYTPDDLLKVKHFIEKHKGQSYSIMTTRKDAVKLMGESLAYLTNELPIFYLPIEIEFIQSGEMFDGFINSHIKNLLQE